MLKIRPLPEDLQKIAIEELNEIPERIPADLTALKEWIGKQPHLNARTDDQFLIAFLRGCKYSLEKAKSKIDKYYTLRTKYPDFYTIQNVDDPRVFELVKLGVGLFLPTPLNENGPRIMWIRAGSYPTDKYRFEDVMCMAHTMQMITLLEDDYAIVNGVVDILDLSQLTGAHMFQMTPTIVQKMSVFAEDAMPLRQKGSHFINMPSGFLKIYNLLKTFMPAKQQQRDFIHGNDLQSLYKHIPQKYLPTEFGGANGTLDELVQSSVQKFLEYREFFRDDLKYGTNEKLRQGPSPDYDSIFGVDGSFRKLDVD